ncbi:MAG: metal-sensing transcriptional repressor [Cyanobacteria bacterium]|nr:metal-sensing transcriptional repressor [Cyanobacteriota bacterium]MDA1020724.1 metal-sensing transcriptional repressor [Cyanobacteriota bacterium]
METADYSKELGKLNRIAGQIEGVKDMISCKRAATEIMIQLKAVRASVKSIESIILEDHLTRHLLNAQDSTDLAERIKATSKLYKKSDL